MVRHEVGRFDDFEPGKFRIFELDGRSIGVVNAGDTFYAVLNVCPHELAAVCEGSLSGTMLPSDPGEVCYGMENQVLRCPWHGWEFDLGNDGRALFTNYRARVRVYPVAIEDGKVFVEMKDRSPRNEHAKDASTTRPS